ncbi:metal-dependent hydrolase, partial [Candidatus Woesearchaeota archaeon]|nr:metal-dependent hydrolase [Candidatus Woesearchaeota archaeon]
MRFYTHLAFGFLLGMISLIILKPSNQILFMGLCLIGSSFPDIDHPRSKVGKYFKPIGWLFEHRGFFHSVFPIIILFLLSKINPLFIPFIIGYGS